jgi:predicted nuclease with TOPRIM domain
MTVYELRNELDKFISLYEGRERENERLKDNINTYEKENKKLHNKIFDLHCQIIILENKISERPSEIRDDDTLGMSGLKDE